MKEITYTKAVMIDGAVLNPSFSIYLIEIISTDYPRQFYIGMTGDNGYPSARSAIHRMTGHLSRRGSTDSQLEFALTQHPAFNGDYSVFNLVMHHYAIPGFEVFPALFKDSVFWYNKEEEKPDNYYMHTQYDEVRKAYKMARREVSLLEKTLIYKYRDAGLVNKQKTKVTDLSVLESGWQKDIADPIEAIIKGS
jgi:hypothetical protein